MYIEKIAKMLGVNLNEHFDIEYVEGNETVRDLFFSEKYLESDKDLTFPELNDILSAILAEDARIIKRPYTPKVGEGFWIVRCKPTEVEHEYKLFPSYISQYDVFNTTHYAFVKCKLAFGSREDCQQFIDIGGEKLLKEMGNLKCCKK